MDQNAIKCPQCGAIHLDRISRNQFKCPYCGYSFTMEGVAEFVKQRKDDNQIILEQERKKVRRKGLRFDGIYGIFILASFCLLPTTPIACDSFERWKEKLWGDKEYYTYSSMPIYDKISFLEAAPFSRDGEKLLFSDYGRKATINNVEHEVDLFYSGDPIVDLKCNSDSSEVCVFYAGKKYVRPNKTYPSNIFYFKNENELREYLCKKPFGDKGETYSFFREANSVKVDGQYVFDYVECEIRDKPLLKRGQSESYKFRNPETESRASIAIHHDGGTDLLYLMMDKDGSNAYLLQYGTNKKFKRMN